MKQQKKPEPLGGRLGAKRGSARFSLTDPLCASRMFLDVHGKNETVERTQEDKFSLAEHFRESNHVKLLHSNLAITK
jgi:hypothetical protein